MFEAIIERVEGAAETLEGLPDRWAKDLGGSLRGAHKALADEVAKIRAELDALKSRVDREQAALSSASQTASQQASQPAAQSASQPAEQNTSGPAAGQG